MQEVADHIEDRSIQHRGEANENAEWVLMFYQNGDNKISSYIDICLDLIENVGATDDVKIAEAQAEARRADERAKIAEERLQKMIEESGKLKSDALNIQN